VQKPKKSLRKAKVFSLKKEKLIREVEKQNKETPRGFDLRTAKCKAGHSKVQRFAGKSALDFTKQEAPSPRARVRGRLSSKFAGEF